MLEIVFIVLAVVVTAFIAEYRAYKNTKKLTQEHRHEVSSLKRDKLELETLKVSAEQELIRAQFFINELEAWKAKAIQCYPEIESLVRVSFAKKEAEEFSIQYPSINTVEATYINYPLLVKALEAYCQLSDEAKMQTYVTLDILKKKRDIAFSNYVSTTTEYLQSADKNLQGIPEHLPQLNKIMEWFNNIPVVVRSEVPGAVIISLSMKEAHAKYMAGITAEQVPEYFVAEPATGISKFFDTISRASATFKKKAGTWLSKKVSDLRTWLFQPFEERYSDEENFEEPSEETPSSVITEESATSEAPASEEKQEENPAVSETTDNN